MLVDPFETAKLSHARALIELLWDERRIRHIFDIEYEGAEWEVIVRMKSVEGANLPGSLEKDFIEELPE
jgi:hypothetical protein